jgi:hypothetical protein
MKTKILVLFAIALALSANLHAQVIITAVDSYYEKEIKIKFRSNIQNLLPANGDSLTVQLIASYKPNASTETKLAYLQGACRINLRNMS